jgi:hypothetical protein
MTRPGQARWIIPWLLVLVIAPGCARSVLDTRVPPPAQAKHCEGSEVVTSTHLATLPIPLVAFFTPRVTLNAPDSAAVLARCGGKQQVNRRVTQNYAVCAPVIFVTTVVTLGIAGICPRLVSWEADVVE